MKINLFLQAVSSSQIPANSRPAPNLLVTESSPYGYELETLRSEVLRLEKKMDPFLQQIFEEFHGGMEFDVPVIATGGFPAPYDTWRKPWNGQAGIFFNLSQWSVDRLKKMGRETLLSELSHFLLKPLLQGTHSEDLAQELPAIILDEGLAQFIAFPFDREKLLTEYADKEVAAEEALKRIYISLLYPQLSPEQKNDILEMGVRGEFWDRPISIAGLFRVARIFSTQEGLSALHEVIRQKKLRAFEPSKA